jgi:hypothetical protein
MKWNKIATGAMAGAAALLVTVTAKGQFEIEPDRFPDPVVEQARSQSRQSGDEISRRIVTLREDLDRFQEQIAVQAEMVDRKRELAAGAGGMGEFSAVFINEYVEEYGELEHLKRELAPGIAAAQASLDQLKRRRPDSLEMFAASAALPKQTAARALRTLCNRRAERLAASMGLTPANPAARR